MISKKILSFYLNILLVDLVKAYNFTRYCLKQIEIEAFKNSLDFFNASAIDS